MVPPSPPPGLEESLEVALPVAPAVGRWRLGTFRALRHPNYRLYFGGQLVSLLGTQVQTTALMWLAHEMTDSALWPSLIAAVQVLPTFLLGPWGGTLADRLPRRALIFAAQSGLLVLALVLALAVLVGHPTRWDLLGIAVASGAVAAIDLPARLSFVMDMVGRDDLLNAVALNSVLFNATRAVGPALGAAALHWLGPGHCFLFNGLSYVAVLVALALMRNIPAPTAPAADHDGSLRAGFRYIAGHRRLVLLLVLTAAMSLCGWPVLSLLPALSDHQLHAGARGYGWMLSAVGCGAMLAALLVASFGTLARSPAFLVSGVCLSSVGLVGLANVTRLPGGLVLSTVLGCGLILFFATSQAVTQLSAGEHNRGVVMGIYSMVASGPLPLGNVLAGLAADVWGVPFVLALQGGCILAAAGFLLAMALALRRPA
jgi:MFS family permease